VMVFGFGLYEFMWLPISQRIRLKRPGRAWFHIPSLNQRKITYAEQGCDSHCVEELTLPANSIIEIEFLFRPSITFEASEIYFGCDAPKGS
jgi:hypothetical protein